jgi:pentatricopeptide repeat protein
MIEQGIKPDEFSFTALVNKVENFNDATSFLDKMIERGLKPNVINFTSLINKTETFQQTYTILERMKTQQVRPNNFTINSLIKKVNQNPRQALETLFATYRETTIFSNYLFNRIITEACKADASCKDLVLSHVPVISQQEDPVIFHYARTMEFIRATSAALELLEHIKEKNFDYYNIKANCLKEKDFEQALELYQTALQFSKDKKQRTITLNNAAQLIVDHKQETLYSTAIDYCKEALSLRPFSQFPYPGHLLIELTTLQSPAEEVEKNLSDIMSTYRMPEEVRDKG